MQNNNLTKLFLWGMILFSAVLFMVTDTITHLYTSSFFARNFSLFNWSIDMQNFLSNWLWVIFMGALMGFCGGGTIAFLISRFAKSKSAYILQYCGIIAVWVLFCIYFANTNQTSYGMEFMIAPILLQICLSAFILFLTISNFAYKFICGSQFRSVLPMVFMTFIIGFSLNACSSDQPVSTNSRNTSQIAPPSDTQSKPTSNQAAPQNQNSSLVSNASNQQNKDVIKSTSSSNVTVKTSNGVDIQAGESTVTYSSSPPATNQKPAANSAKQHRAQ